jgi:hypothetical protein
MVVLPSAADSRYHKCCIDGGTNPEYFEFPRIWRRRCFNPLRMTLICFIYRPISYRTVNPFHLLIRRSYVGYPECRYLSFLNISRTGCVDLMQLGNQLEETLLPIHEQSLSREASQSAVIHRWLSSCTLRPSHAIWPSEQISFITTMRLSVLYLSCMLLWQTITSAPLQSRFGSPRLLTFPIAEIAVERKVICECGGHTVYKLSQRHLTADLLAPRENGCSVLHSKVSSDWLPNYIKARPPVLEILKNGDPFRTALVFNYFVT